MDVVIPWRAGCPHRRAALGWVTARHEDVGRTVHVGWMSGDWCKARAVQNGMPRSGVVVVSDADVWCDGLDQAIQAVEDGAPWAVPHTSVKRLDEASTAAVLDGGPLGGTLDQKRYLGKAGGGIVVTTVDVWRSIPMDPRFVGWGQEDLSWAVALERLAGPMWRGDADLWHLWHPPQDRASRHHGTAGGVQLYRRYCKADHGQLLAIAAEARQLLDRGAP